MPVPSEPEANDDDELARFVTMLGELGHPSPGQGIAARASDIARFIAIAGHPLPRSYVAFVERFGEQAPVFIAIGDGRGFPVGGAPVLRRGTGRASTPKRW
jgi:hypothetical protein